MAEDEPKLYDLTRRKTLAGIGAVGVASLGAGLGTSAYFSDQETFEDNSLVAGSLDMKVDWEEHYSDWSADEEQFARMPSSEEEADYVLPPLTASGALVPDAKPIELVFDGETDQEKEDAKNALWDATSVEALPDGTGGSYDGIQDEVDDAAVCTDDGRLVDVGGDAEGLSSSARTEGTFAGQTTQPGDPLINIDDIKPGDFGEVTLSYHLCDNPGYVWMNGELVSAAENGHTEPEASDPDSFGSENEVATTLDNNIELLDEIVTRMWYDPNGNNQVDVVAGELDIMLALDASGSIGGTVGTEGTEADNLVKGVEAFVDALPDTGSVQLGQVVFGENSDVSRFAGLDSVGNYALDYPNDPDGNTPLPPAIDIADQELQANGRPNAEQIVVVFTDGAPNYANGTYSTGGYTAPRANDFSLDDADLAYDGAASGESETEQEETALVAEKVRNGGGPATRIAAVNVGSPPGRSPSGATDADGDDYPKDLDVYLMEDVATAGFYFEAALDDLATVADDLVALVAVSDEVFFQGTLREALAVLSTNEGRGVPLDGDTATAFDELSDAENDADRDCFAGGGTTHYVGFQWWLPIDHANQIQTDSVSFDLGFYTEQCRHNDGSGMVPEETATPEATPTP
jgi:predicted ribosomally synthesized peptide with SipW-like signal peptide